MWEYITNTKKKTESKEDPKKRITVSRYGKKDDKNVFLFRILEISTEDGPGPGLQKDPWVDDEFKSRSPLGFPGSQYFIAVKELIIEWEDTTRNREICGYIECFQCENSISENWNMQRKWVPYIAQHIRDKYEDSQLLRFAKPLGKQTTFLNIENEKFFGLELHCKNGTQRHFGTEAQPEWLHEIQCAIKPMFDENEVLPIKNAHITVEIIIK